MSFIDAIKSCLSQYVNFNGRARRSEYWWYELAYLICSIIINTIAKITGIGLLATIFNLALLVPSLAVCVRRLHDIGKRWPWLLIAFIPIIGEIWLIVLYCKDSVPGDNEFGPNPKGL